VRGRSHEAVEDDGHGSREDSLARLGGVDDDSWNSRWENRAPGLDLPRQLRLRQLGDPAVDETGRSLEDENEVGLRHASPEQPRQCADATQAVSPRVDDEVPPAAFKQDDIAPTDAWPQPKQPAEHDVDIQVEDLEGGQPRGIGRPGVRFSNGSLVGGTAGQQSRSLVDRDDRVTRQITCGQTINESRLADAVGSCDEDHGAAAPDHGSAAGRRVG
jgi:hypothetical protein